jgi:MinD-like ATPase involved in chromosome partitioning or flagellar assembly
MATHKEPARNQEPADRNQQKEPARVIAMFGAAGGQGTSACVTALAGRLAERKQQVLVIDTAGDQAAIFAVPTDPEGPEEQAITISSRIELVAWGMGQFGLLENAEMALHSIVASARAHFDFVLIDAGALWSPGADAVRYAVDSNRAITSADERLLVCRGQYTALRRSVRSPMLSEMTGAIAVTHPERPLRAREIADVLQVTIRESVEESASVARAYDAGVLFTRIPEGFMETLADEQVSLREGVSAWA